MKHRRTILTALLFLAIGCTGDAGPMGPQGEQGLDGLPGPGTRVVVTEIIDSWGVASVHLPVEIGVTLPSLAVYEGKDGFWLAVTDGYWMQSSPWFAVVWSETYGVWIATIYQGNPGWTAAFVVVY